MRLIQRRVGMIVLLALLTIPSAILAQDDQATVVGSGIVAPAFEALVETSETTGNVSVEVTGTNSGFEQFCAGEVDAVLSSRPILVDEEATCTEAGVSYHELLLGHNVLAFIANESVDANQCLTTVDLNTLLAPSAEGQITTWQQVNPEFANQALNLFLPAANTVTGALLDNTIEGIGVRQDFTAGETDAAIVERVLQNEGAFGVVTLPALQGVEGLTVFEVDAGTGSGCAEPSAENVENRVYPAADRLFIYINSESPLTSIDPLHEALTSEANAAVIEQAGFVAPTADAYATNERILNEDITGREFSRDVLEFELPEQIIGAISLGGSAVANDYLQQITTALTTANPGVTVDLNIEGEPAGFRRLCNGEIDVVAASGDLSEEQQANCDANNIDLYSVDLGSIATVMVSNAENDYAACLTTDQLRSLWLADSADEVTTWSQVDASFPETDLTLLAPPEGDRYTDLLVRSISDRIGVVRPDVETFADPLYRAAAVANVDGAITYMSWPDYQSVVNNNQANIQLVSVDAGNGCVDPSESTIGSGEYPISRSVRLLFNRASLARPEAQAFLWSVLSDENYSQLQMAGLTGISFGELPDLRDEAQIIFTEAEVEAAALAEVTPSPEATEGAEADATTEATASAS